MEEKYSETGALYKIFRNSTAKLLDQIEIVGTMPQTISMLSESTDLTFKTVQKIVLRLIEMGFMEEFGKIGNASVYRFKKRLDVKETLMNG